MERKGESNDVPTGQMMSLRGQAEILSIVRKTSCSYNLFKWLSQRVADSVLTAKDVICS